MSPRTEPKIVALAMATSRSRLTKIRMRNFISSPRIGSDRQNRRFLDSRCPSLREVHSLLGMIELREKGGQHQAQSVCAALLHCRIRKWRNLEGRGQSAKRSEEHTSELQSQSNLVCR